MRQIKVWAGGLSIIGIMITGVSAFGANIGGPAGGGGRISASAPQQPAPVDAATIDAARWAAVKRIEQARREADRRLQAWLAEQAIRAKVSRSGLSWPRVDMITSHFGPRRRGSHHGMDILCSRQGGEPIYAAAPGRVVTASTLPIYGRAAVVQHPNGTRTLYAHMWSVKVHAGDRVERGQAIGTCGSTGNSTAPHLHFEFYLKGRPVNPLHHLPAWK